MQQVEVTVLPRYWKHSTLLGFVPSILIFGCGGASPGAGCSNPFVFSRLTVRPKAFAAVNRSWQVLPGLVQE